MFLRLGVSNSHIWRLVILTFKGLVFLCLGGLVILTQFGVRFLTFGGK